jgi:small-conductance mechanosensitive channel
VLVACLGRCLGSGLAAPHYDNALRKRSELRFAIFKALKDGGVLIPFPQRDVHMMGKPAADSDSKTDSGES